MIGITPFYEANLCRAGNRKKCGLAPMTYGISTIMALNNNFILWVCIVSGGDVLIILSHVFEVIDMRIDNFNIVF
ncbi:TPA: hypothetical protein MF110_10955 [Klebsiella pneumoniae]|nr:hypothetical protein [Klebsiella pneumoniae]HBX0757222.1 hypothetical protein [Klebsiella pneumoniae]HBX3219520.1 hypothetical protein [Klebsiella pneumoniae]HBX6081319.1 hypothetical protein [Klebsiella pneumoniae]HBZ2248289.1 hypothetical protein [Klebsiella pneumoniae]